MKASKTHEYLGHSILPCAYINSLRWYVYYKNWSEECCQQFNTLAEAKLYIRELIAHEEDRAKEDALEKEEWNAEFAKHDAKRENKNEKRL